MVPILAWREEPSDLTRKANTTLRMEGTAPQVTAHLIYSEVAAAFFADAPRSPSSGVLNNPVKTENKTELMNAQYNPNTEQRRTRLESPRPRARLMALEVPTPNRLLIALNARSAGAASVIFIRIFLFQIRCDPFKARLQRRYFGVRKTPADLI